jgi:hypothetical protein
MEEKGITIQLANKDVICPLGMISDVEVLVGKIKYPADFVLLYLVDLSYILLVLKLICQKRECLLNMLEKD